MYDITLKRIYHFVDSNNHIEMRIVIHRKYKLKSSIHEDILYFKDLSDLAIFLEYAREDLKLNNFKIHDYGDGDYYIYDYDKKQIDRKLPKINIEIAYEDLTLEQAQYSSTYLAKVYPHCLILGGYDESSVKAFNKQDAEHKLEFNLNRTLKQYMVQDRLLLDAFFDNNKNLIKYVYDENTTNYLYIGLVEKYSCAEETDEYYELLKRKDIVEKALIELNSKDTLYIDSHEILKNINKQLQECDFTELMRIKENAPSKTIAGIMRIQLLEV